MNSMAGGINKGVMLFVILITGSLLCSAQPVSIQPETLSMKAYPGEFAEAYLNITNNQDFPIIIEVYSISGRIQIPIPELERVYSRIQKEEKKQLRIRGYVLKSATPGKYDGEIVIKGNEVIYIVPTSLTVMKREEEKIAFSLRIAPERYEIKPSGILEVRSSIQNLGERTANVELVFTVIDKEFNKTIASTIDYATVATKIDKRSEIKIPEDTEEKDYLLRAGLYYTKEENRTLYASDQVDITVKSSIFDILAPITSRITLARMGLGIVLILILVITLMLSLYLRREWQRRKRYLESINFEALPQKGLRMGFIGKIAETKNRAFFPIDELPTHTMMAGATGCGKTIAVEILAEEALKQGVSVIVIDPTAHWSGFIRKNENRDSLGRYKEFGMSPKDAHAFKGNIYSITDPEKRIDMARHITEGEITVFYLQGLNNPEIEAFIGNSVDMVIEAKLKESKELKLLLIYDEIHRILPKFGGTGKGFVQIEKAVREFRPLGIGVVLISQVLQDFMGEVSGNIGTEIQMQTRYKEDLDRIKLKYGNATYRSVVKTDIGSGMIHNAQYNKGYPYFVDFRPPFHNPEKISDELLEQYSLYNERLDGLYSKLNILEKENLDVFDIELELNLAKDNLKEASFGIVDLYVKSLTSRIDEYLNRLKKKEITEEDLAVRSEWDVRKDEEIQAYEKELSTILEEEEKRLEERESILKAKQEEEKKRMEEERKKLEQEEKQIREELGSEKRKLENKAKVLDLLKRHKELKILGEKVRLREREKLRIGEEKLKELEAMKNKQLEEERRRHEEEEKKRMEEARKREEELRKEAEKVDEHRKKIIEDKKIILGRDRVIGKKEKKLAEEIKGKIANGIRRQKEIRDRLLMEKEEERRKELERKESELEKKLEEERKEREREARQKREDLKKEKDRLQGEFNEIKNRWGQILDRERELSEKKEELERRRRAWEARIEREGVAVEEGEGWEDFQRMDEEWKRMDDMREENKRLEEGLEKIRNELRAQADLKIEEKEAMHLKKEEIERLEKLKKGEPELEKPPEESVEELSTRERELDAKLQKVIQEIEVEKKRITELEDQEKGWEVFEVMEKEWKSMDELRVERKGIEEELEEIRKKTKHEKAEP